MHVAKLWAFFNPLTKILIVAESFVKLHLFALVLNLWMYAARDSFSHCWISMKYEVYVWILVLHSLSNSKSFISSQDVSVLFASMTNVQVNPLDLAFASLAQLSLFTSAAVSISINQSSNFVESYSLKTVMTCSKELVRFVCFCVVHNALAYWHITSPKGSVCVGIRDGWSWSARERFCNSHSMWSKLSADCPSLASTCWHKSFISLVCAVNLAWWLGIGSLGLPSASCPPNATVVSEPLILSLSLSMPVVSVSSTWRHLVYSAIGLIPISDLSKHGLEWWMHSFSICAAVTWHVQSNLCE